MYEFIQIVQNNANMNTIKFYLKNDVKDDNFYYFVIDNAASLTMEAVIIAIALTVTTLIFKFSIVSLVFWVIGVSNLIVIIKNILESKIHLNKKTINYKITYGMNEFFLSLKILSSLMKEKGLNDKDILKWQSYYVNRILENKSLNTILVVSGDIQEHYKKIALIDFPEIIEKEVEQFAKKDSKIWWDKYYPNFNEDLKAKVFANKANVKKKSDNSNGGGTNYRLEQNLKVLGLPASTREMKLIKKRYFELVKMYHPDSAENKDKDPKEIQDKIIEINSVYQEIEKMLKQ